MADLLDREHYEGNVLDAIKELRNRIEALERTDLSGVAGPQGPTGPQGPQGPTGSPGPGAPSPLTQGDVLVVDSTPEITTLGIGNAHEMLKVNAAGTDPAWEPFDWDEMSGVAGADMVHDHSSAAEGGQLIDLNGAADAFVLDTDGDTTLSAPTDDQVDLEIGGSDLFVFIVNQMTFKTSAAASNAGLLIAPSGTTRSIGWPNVHLEGIAPGFDFYETDTVDKNVKMVFDGGYLQFQHRLDDGTLDGIPFLVDITAPSNSFRIQASGNVGIGVAAPGSLIEWNFATENLEFVDAGSIGATEQDWIEVQVGGVTGYIRVYAAK